MTTHLNLENLLAPAMAVLGFELISCKFISNAGRRTLRIYIDSPTGPTVDDCIHANQQINAILAAETAIGADFDLEVSSPGLDRPLITLAHFQRFLQKEVKIKLRHSLDNRRNFTGQLLAATEHGIEILVDGKTVKFDFDNIEKANLVPELRF